MIPTKMKAWILTEPGRLELQTVLLPAIRQDQVLVKIDRACICNGSDPGIFHGHEAYRTPLIFGHEASGRIVQKGKDVTEFQIGDRVCWWFEAGAFAQYQAVTPNQIAIFLVPEAVSLDASPILELAIAACRSLMEIIPEHSGKTLLICGLGPSGLILLQYARALGFERVIGWDLHEARRKLALALGADEVYNPAQLNKATVESLPESDIGVLMIGNDCLPEEPTTTLFMRNIKRGGMVISYGHPENGCRFSPYVFQSRNLCMKGPVNDWNVIRRKGKELIQMISEEKIKLDPLITDKVSFEDFLPAFYNILEKPEEQIKVILYWEDNVPY